MTINEKSKRTANRIAVAIAGGVLIITGAASLFAGRTIYPNYWGGLVFAPIAILAGCLAIYIAIFRSSMKNLPTRDKKGRPIRYPADEYRKW